jgi:hypothetical protein
MTITARRICWPNPDATCLEGGCGYCNYYPFRSLTTILRHVAKADSVKDRCGKRTKPAIKAYEWGYRRDFVNADTK